MAAVEFVPAISVGVSATDNVELVVENPQRATVYQLLPSFTLTQTGRRITSALDYQVEAYRYDELDEDDVYQSFSGDFVAALDPDNFFFEIGASRGQTIRFPEAPIPWDNLGITSNRVDRNDYYVGPSFQYPFGGNGTMQGSFRRERIDYDEEPGVIVSEFDADSFQFSLDNYRKERGFTWAVQYNGERTDFGLPEPWQYRQAGIEIGSWVTSRLRFFASGGLESPWDDPRVSSLEDEYWEVGFASGGPSVSVELAAGERSIGSSGRASIYAEFPHARTEIQYSEGPATQGHDQYQDQIIDGQFPDFLSRPGATESYISKLFRWSVDFDLQRTTFSASIYDESREGRQAVGGVPLEDEAQSGVDLMLSWSVGARTSIRFHAREAWREFGSDEYHSKSLAAGADYQLGRSTECSLTLSRTRDESGFGLGYRADLVTVLLTRRFGVSGRTSFRE